MRCPYLSRVSWIRTFFLALILSSGACIGLHAQPPSISDTLNAILDIPPRLTVNLDTRHTFISGQPVTTWGLRGGLRHGKRVQYGVGFHWMEHGFRKQFSEDQPASELRLAYVAPYFEYSFIHRKNWEVAIPLRLGIGRSKLLVPQPDGSLDSDLNGLVMLYEPAMSAKYRFLDYFGVGLAVGYRLVLVNNQKIDQQFNAPTWGILFSVDLGKVYDDLSDE